jgi:tRNA (Thr-GGU) A37 N-methylase
VPPPGAGAEGAAGAAGVDWLSVAFPLRPIGVLRSAFGRRNGTPRQPGLVPAARAELCLRPDLPPGLLAGLEGFSQ